MSNLPTQTQVQAEFDAASEAGVSPCMWIPPTWQEVQALGGRFPDNSSDEEPFKNPKGSQDALDRIAKGKLKQAPQPPESAPDDVHWTNPFADFSHVDPYDFQTRSLELVKRTLDRQGDVRKMDSLLTRIAGLFNAKRKKIVAALGGNQALFEKAVEVLKGAAFPDGQELAPVADVLEKPGEFHDAVAKVVKGHKLAFEDVVSVIRGTLPDLLNRRNALNRLQRIVGPDQPGMKRLALVFEWSLWRATVLLNNLNDTLNKGVEADYTDARETYIKFLKDLDDHEPENSTEPIDVRDPKARSGYGRAIKWNYIAPVIYGGQIVGARAVIKWNPHSSSNGIPIPH